MAEPDLEFQAFCGVHSRGAGNWRQLMAGSGGSQGLPVMALAMASKKKIFNCYGSCRSRLLVPREVTFALLRGSEADCPGPGTGTVVRGVAR